MRLLSLLLIVLPILSCSHAPKRLAGDPKLKFEGEVHLENIRQLTHGGTNAEAYWSFDGTQLTFQHGGPSCDQIFTMNTDGSELKLLSNGKGRTTCSYFLPGDDRVLFSSTAATDASCPQAPDRSQGYVWPIYNSYQMYIVKTDGTDLLPFEPAEPRAYNAEATVCKDGSVVFTSDRSGDLELYRGKLDRFSELSEVTRITQSTGYDGGAFFSPDCSKIVWRASRPRSGEETDEYKHLLKQHLVKPTELEIWMANSDGSHAHQVTRMGVASFAPFFTPDGKRILFASNPRDPDGRKFDLYLINTDGTGLERVTFSDTFESFPMFSPDGKTLAFSSNRNASAPHETNVFLADWMETAAPPQSPSDNSAERFKSAVTQLSAPEMEGRAPGTAGLTRAEDFVTAQFAALGLKPYPSKEKDLKQNVNMVTGKDKHAVSANNIIGAWGKACSGKTPPVVIGAHLDHLGNGGPDSLEASQTGLHPGADDNASGVAAMLEAARMITTSKPDPSACFVFAAFTGEEIGVAGSSQFMAALKKQHIKPKSMLNLDMVGRMENNHLIVFGSDSAQEWRSILTDECDEEHLLCDGGGDGYGPSDHMAFYVAGVPVLHFFTGPHADYHRTTDTADKINATGGVQTATVVAAVAMQAASRAQSFHYQKASATPTMGKLTGTGERRGNGAYLGTIPDYATLSSPHGPAGGGEAQGGVKLAGVRAGSPAEKAGIKEGDVLIAIGSKNIGTLEDFMNILTGLHPGDEVVMHIKRKGADLALPAKVGKRE